MFLIFPRTSIEKMLTDVDVLDRKGNPGRIESIKPLFV